MSETKITIESLRQPNFAPEELLRSAKAKELGLDNTPNYNQLTCGVHLAKKLQELHNALSAHLKSKVIIDVTSGFRSAAVNKAVKGDPKSWHMQFLACDFNLRGRTPDQVVALIKACDFKVDKCLVETGCVHVQFNLDSKKDRNLFGIAERVNGEWEVKWMQK